MNKNPQAYKVLFQHPEHVYEAGAIAETATPPLISQWPSGNIRSIASEDDTVAYRKNRELFTVRKGDVVAWPSDTVHVEPFCDTVLSITRLAGGKERLRRHYGPGFSISKTIIESQDPIFLARLDPCLGSYTTGGRTVVFAIEWREFRELLETPEPVEWALWLSSNDVIYNDVCSGSLSGVLIYQTQEGVKFSVAQAQASFLCPEDYETSYEEIYEGADVLTVENVEDYIRAMVGIVAHVTDGKALNVSIAPFEAVESEEREFEQLFHVLTEDHELLLVAVSSDEIRPERQYGLPDSEKEELYGYTVSTAVLSSDVSFYKAGGEGLAVYRDAGADDKKIIISFYGRDDVQELLLAQDETINSIDASFSRGEIEIYYTSV